MAKRFASLSLDLDNKWSYLKTHGDEGWDEYPSYLGLVMPRILGLLDKLELRITFFVVGRDAARPENADALRSITAAGHEIGNHSYNHEPWLHLYQPDEIEEELSRTEEAIDAAMGVRPTGFRGPGYSSSPDLLATLVRRGYQFDASKLPTFIGPLARAYYLFRSNLGSSERKKRKQLFGSLSEGFCPLKPFLWQWEESGEESETASLLEMPVTTMPFFRVPFHFSYLHYLSQYSTSLAWLYWRTSLSMCKVAGVEPSLLLHPLDFLDANDEPSLDFFPGMKVESKQKIEFLERTLRSFADSYQVEPMSQHAQEILKRGGLKTKKLAGESPSQLPAEEPVVSLNRSMEESCSHV